MSKNDKIDINEQKLFLQFSEIGLAMNTEKNYKDNKGAARASFVFLFAALVILDQFTKSLADNIYLNHFFAFSLRVNIILMHAIYFAGIAGIAIYLRKHFYHLAVKDFAGWIMILSGAVSNVGERIILGYVRDWIYIGSGVFNLADGYIVIGIFILLYSKKRKTMTQ